MGVYLTVLFSMADANGVWGRTKPSIESVHDENFNALISINTKLKSEWGAKACKQGAWEVRMLRDLSQWMTAAGEFKCVQCEVDSLSMFGFTSLLLPLSYG